MKGILHLFVPKSRTTPKNAYFFSQFWNNLIIPVALLDLRRYAAFCIYKGQNNSTVIPCVYSILYVLVISFCYTLNLLYICTPLWD